MNVIVNISGEDSLNIPSKIAKIQMLWDDFVVPKSIYFSRESILNLEDIFLAYETYIHGEKYIIRSAHQNEDGKEKSYAGIYISKKGVYSRASLWNDISSIIEWLRENDYVLIQEYIEADYSWIYFGNVGNGNSSIEYIAGWNELLTNWSEVGSSILLNTEWQELIHRIEYQNSILRDSLRIEKYKSYASICVNERSILKENLWRLKKHFWNNIDVEWLIKDWVFHVLQIRDITAPLLLSNNAIDKDKIIPPLREILGKCSFVKKFFIDLWFEPSNIVFDVGWGLLHSGILGNHREQNQLVQIIESDKIYILFWNEDTRYQHLFRENERNELRLKNGSFEKIFKKYQMKTGILFSLARLPVNQNFCMYHDCSYPGLFFLRSEEPFHVLLEQKNNSEWVSLIPLANEILFSSFYNLDKLKTFRLTVTKDINIARLGDSVFVGFDVRDYSVHQNIKLLLLERSSHLSHGAILAREMGIPCIYGIKWISHRLKNWEKLYIDIKNNLIKIY